MRLAPIILRLRAECPLLMMVGGAADYGSASNLLGHQLPAAFVIPMGDNASPNNVVGMIEQHDIERFAVILAVSNLADIGGLEVNEDLADIRDQVRGALLGFLPPNHVDEIEAVSGRLLEFDDGVLWWQDEFTTGLYFRN